MWFKLYNLEQLYLIKKKNFLELNLTDNKFLEKKALILNSHNVKKFSRNYNDYYYFLSLDKNNNNHYVFKINNPFFLMNFFFKKQYYLKKNFSFFNYENLFFLNLKKKFLFMKKNLLIQNDYKHFDFFSFYFKKFKKFPLINQNVNNLNFFKKIFLNEKKKLKKQKTLFLDKEFLDYKVLHFNNTIFNENIVIKPFETKINKVSLLDKKKNFLIFL